MMKRFMMKLAVALFTVFMLLQGVSVQAADIELVPAFSSVSTASNRVWVGTFQLVWNKFSESVIKGPIVFEDYDSPVAQALNAKEFTKDDLDSSAYYIKYGTVSPKLKQTIESGIKRKFKEKSDILDTFDWTLDPNKYIVYAMLKKDFKFKNAFDKLPEGGFGSNPEPVKYFGINSISNSELYDNVGVLFYNSPSDYAVKLYTKGKDAIILYRTNSEKTFDKYYNDIIRKTQGYNGSPLFQYRDTLLIPDLNLYLETGFEDVEGHKIKGTDVVIDKTIETVDFKLNNEGVKLKSEAALMARTTSFIPATGRDFNFNDTFVLFLVEQGKTVPYYAMRVNDVETLNKTGR